MKKKLKNIDDNRFYSIHVIHEPGIRVNILKAISDAGWSFREHEDGNVYVHTIGKYTSDIYYDLEKVFKQKKLDCKMDILDRVPL